MSGSDDAFIDPGNRDQAPGWPPAARTKKNDIKDLDSGAGDARAFDEGFEFGPDDIRVHRAEAGKC